VTDGSRWWTLAVLCIATFMLLLDVTVVNVALPGIERDLGASLSDLQWVISAYALSLGATLLAAGSLADRVGRRRVFTFGLVLFSLAPMPPPRPPRKTIAWNPSLSSERRRLPDAPGTSR
jgi:MFS family permease